MNEAWNLECANTGMRSYPRRPTITIDPEERRLQRVLEEARILALPRERELRTCAIKQGGCGRSFQIPVSDPDTPFCRTCRRLKGLL